MDNVSLHDCMHDLTNIWSFLILSDEVQKKYPELVEDDDIEEDELEKLTIRGYGGKNTTTNVTGVGLS